MDKAIFIDKANNATRLKHFLANQSSEFDKIKVLEKKDVLSAPGSCIKVKYLFSTWDMPILSEKEIDLHFPSLEAIFYAAGEVNYFSLPYSSRGVKIYSARNENSIPVAEFVFAQILLANKGYFQAQDTYRRGLWRLGYKKARRLAQQKPGNIGAQVGLIGCGTIGSKVASMLKRQELNVVVYDPYVDDNKIRNLGVARIGLEELFRTSDIVTNHLPDTEETLGMLRYSHFSSMKPTATFINTGRGRQIDESGLARAMRECPSKSALLDVTRREPPDPLSPIYRANNIFLSPHIAGSQGKEIDRLYQAALLKFHEYTDK